LIWALAGNRQRGYYGDSEKILFHQRLPLKNGRTTERESRPSIQHGILNFCQELQNIAFRFQK